MKRKRKDSRERQEALSIAVGLCVMYCAYNTIRLIRDSPLYLYVDVLPDNHAREFQIPVVSSGLWED